MWRHATFPISRTLILFATKKEEKYSMEMTKMFFCLECLSSLEEAGADIAHLYESFCELYIANHGELPISIDGDNKRSIRTMLHFLEQRGYIVTTEAVDIDKKLIKFKPLGYEKINDDLHLFCPLGCDKEELS